MTYSCLRVEALDGDVLRITIDRPGDDLNTIDATLHAELADVFGDLRRERDARAALLTGSGRAFSAGGNFAWFPELRTPDRLADLRRDARRLLHDLVDVEIPVVAAVNGPAMGLGATIALLCDVVFMATSALIGDPHVRAGIVAGDGGTAVWPMLIGPGRAKRYLLTGDSVDAVTAERLGLVAEVVPDDDLADVALAFARRLAAGPPLAVQYTKAAMNNAVRAAIDASVDTAMALELQTLRSADHEEAIAALTEHREARFEGR